MQAYYDKMENLFIRSKLEDAEQKKRFFFQLCLIFFKNCVMWDYVNMDVKFVATLTV